jgi:hypothetical protein
MSYPYQASVVARINPLLVGGQVLDPLNSTTRFTTVQLPIWVPPGGVGTTSAAMTSFRRLQLAADAFKRGGR